MKSNKFILCFLLLIAFVKVNAQNFLTRDIYFFAANSNNNEIKPLSNDSIVLFSCNVTFSATLHGISHGILSQPNFTASTKYDSLEYTPNPNFIGIDTILYSIFNTQTSTTDTQKMYIFVGETLCDVIKNLHSKLFGYRIQSNILTVTDSFPSYFGKYPITNKLGFYSSDYTFSSNFLVDSFNNQHFYTNYYSLSPVNLSYSNIITLNNGQYNYFNITEVTVKNFRISGDSLTCFDTLSFGVNIGSHNYLAVDDYYVFNTNQLNDTLNIFQNDFPQFNYAMQFNHNQPAHGYINQLNNEIVYHPNVNFSGVDSFKYFTCYFNGTTNFCDTATVRIFVQCANKYTQLTASICDSTTYQFGNNQLHLTGVYSDTLLSAAGCDSIAELNLTVRSSSHVIIPAKICYTQSYIIYNDTLTSSGNYSYNFTNYLGCDSVRILHLTVIPHYGLVLNKQICSNGYYNFNGKILTNSGTYFDTLTNSLGCDSINTLVLSVLPYNFNNYNQTICEGNYYNLNGIHLYNQGIYADTFTNHFGCDSIIQITLHVIKKSYDTLYQNICIGSYFPFHASLLTNSGTYNDTMLNYLGCDSIITLHLNVLSPVYGTGNDFICNGYSYNFHNKILHSSGIFIDTVLSYLGCDSIVTLNLSLRYPSTSAIWDTICSNQFYNLNGHLFNHTGVFYDTLTNAQGCDSIITLHLKVHNYTFKAIFGQICANKFYNFRGKILNQTGVYYDTTINQFGCDSFISLYLTVYQLNVKTLYHSICNGQTYSILNHTFNTSGTYILDTIPALAGGINCDTINKLQLTVNNPDTSVIRTADTLYATGLGSVFYWIDCHTKKPIHIISERKFVADSTGDYQLVLNYNGCLDTGSCYHISIATGIESFSNNNYFKIFPNPTDEKLQIEVSSSSMNEVRIITLNGSILLKEKLNQKLNNIDVSDLPNGLYQLEVIDAQHRKYYQKLSVLHH